MAAVEDAQALAEGTATAPGRLAAPADDILHPVVQQQCSLNIQLRRGSAAVVGRASELSTIEKEIRSATSGLAAVCLEGEPGIGKTRLLVAASDMAASNDFAVVAVTADEEIRGPFLLARSVFAAQSLRDAAHDGIAAAAIGRATEAIQGSREPGVAGLSPAERLLRAFDLSAVALAEVAAQQPLALLVDDIQWADDDSLRMLRYVVRSIASSRLFLLLALRSEELTHTEEAVNLLADMDRIGAVRRLRLARFTQPESAELLGQTLGGRIDALSAATMHAQSEGVPFIVEELARTYREAGLVQSLDGVWTLARNAGRLVPGAVRTLIQRRAGHLPPDTIAALADAALLGRSFSLRDLQAIRGTLGAVDADSAELADLLGPATASGLLYAHAEGSAADYTFTHEQVRDFAAAQLSRSRRRQIHAAIVDLLVGSGTPDPASLPMLAEHALGAGDARRAAEFSIAAARAALTTNAPEEALRIVGQALPSASTAEERRALLTARDDAYAMARRPVDRLEGLSELSALAEALHDTELEHDVMLRRSAALRLARENDAAGELARRVQALAAARNDDAAELRAVLELGQALTGAAIGESFSFTPHEVDLDAAEAAYVRARELAADIGDEAREAAATRELGIIAISRVRAWFVEQVQAGRAPEFARRIGSGETPSEMLGTFPIASVVHEADRLLTQALDIYERLGDRRGVMSTVIAMAFVSYGPLIHLTSSARHIEEVRRVMSRMQAMVTESERARTELQMLYGVQVYALAKVVPDLALARGSEAYQAARVQADRSIEFRSALGLVALHLDFGELDEARSWLERASSAAGAAPSPAKARELELWRGRVEAAAGNVDAMIGHLERAVQLATEQRSPAARSEALARLALESARAAERQSTAHLLDVAERAAREAKAIVPGLPGHPTWGAQADVALALVELTRGATDRATAAATSALQALEDALHEDMDLEILLPAARVLDSVGADEARDALRDWLRSQLAGIAQRTLDEDVRVRWLRGPVGRELARAVGSLDGMRTEPVSGEAATQTSLTAGDEDLLRLLTEGSSNREIADRLGVPEETVTRRLAETFARIGAASRAEATSFAFRGGVA